MCIQLKGSRNGYFLPGVKFHLLGNEKHTQKVELSCCNEFEN
jgi:hypothetical protein